jgi:hemoglobin-like flavoprotein
MTDTRTESVRTEVNRSDAALLKESLVLIGDRAPQLIAAFYQDLFTARPDLRPLFPADLTAQRDKLLTAIVGLAHHYHHPGQLRPALAELGRRHVRYGAQPAHYDAVGSCLLAALRATLGPAWTDQYQAAWTRAYNFTATTMQQAAATPTAARSACTGRFAVSEDGGGDDNTTAGETASDTPGSDGVPVDDIAPAVDGHTHNNPPSNNPVAIR